MLALQAIAPALCSCIAACPGCDTVAPLPHCLAVLSRLTHSWGRLPVTAQGTFLPHSSTGEGTLKQQERSPMGTKHSDSWLKSRLFLDSWKFLRSGIRHLRATGLHSSLPAAGRRTALQLDPRRHRGAGVPLLMLSQLPSLCPHCSFSRPLFQPGPRTVILNTIYKAVYAASQDLEHSALTHQQTRWLTETNAPEQPACGNRICAWDLGGSA